MCLTSTDVGARPSADNVSARSVPSLPKHHSADDAPDARTKQSAAAVPTRRCVTVTGPSPSMPSSSRTDRTPVTNPWNGNERTSRSTAPPTAPFVSSVRPCAHHRALSVDGRAHRPVGLLDLESPSGGRIPQQPRDPRGIALRQRDGDVRTIVDELAEALVSRRRQTGPLSGGAIDDGGRDLMPSGQRFLEVGHRSRLDP